MYQIQEAYNDDNPYHNKYHATDVVNNIYWFIQNVELIKNTLSDFQKFMMVVGAAIHDVDHNGKNNHFHKMTKSYLALRYNDQSILENHHISYSFKLMSSNKEKYDWLSDINDDKLIEAARNYLIEMVLSTDNSLHKKHIQHMYKLKS